MKRNNILILSGLLATILIWFSGCTKYHRIDGNDIVGTETRQLLSFNKIENSGTFEVYIKQDSVYTAKVEAETNLIPHIRTRINGNTLEIDTRENLHNNYPMKIYVTSPIIYGAYLSGSGYIHIDSLETQNMEIKISGSGEIDGYIESTSLIARISGSGDMDLEAYTNSCDVRISGSGKLNLMGESLTGDFSISGSGNIRSTNFEQKECVAKISGSGDMYVNVSDFLDVTITGSGNVYYIGDPQLNINISGSGSVIKQ